MQKTSSIMMRTIVCALFSACSAAASAADLVDVYRQAQSSDATYRIARAAWAAAQERIPQGRAGLLPLASISASGQYSDRSTRFRDDLTPRTSADFGSSTLSLSVTQPLYRRQNVIVYEQSFTQAEQADAQLALAAQELILRVAQAYFDVLLAQDNIAFAEAQKAAIAEQLEQAKRNFDVGTATITDTHEAQARYDLTTAQELAARNDLELRRRALEQVIARTAPPLAPLGARFTLKSPEPAMMDTWVGLAQRGNLQVRIARSALEFSAQEIDRNRAAHYPTFDAFATLSNAGAGPSLGGGARTDTRTATIGIQLALPLYQGGIVSSRVREAIANQTRSGEELEAARRTAEFNARQAFLGITSGIAQVRALEAALVSTESQLESTRVGQSVGVRTQVDVLNSQQLLFSASRDLARSKYDYILSLLRLEAAIGELAEDDLTAVNQWLDRNASTASRRPDTPVSAAAAPPPTIASKVPPPAIALEVPPPMISSTTPAPVTPSTGPEHVVPSTTPEPVSPSTELAPVIASTTPAPAPRVASDTAKPATLSQGGDSADVLRTLEAWARAWALNDVGSYFDYYGADFELPRGMSRSAWEAERKARIQKPRKIEVTIESPVVTFDGPDRATVAFLQHYRSGALDVSSDKTLVMKKTGGLWRIQQERVQAERPR